jgi:hypothetical protein
MDSLTSIENNRKIQGAATTADRGERGHHQDRHRHDRRGGIVVALLRVLREQGDEAR